MTPRRLLLAALLVAACAPAPEAPKHGPPSTRIFGGARPAELIVPGDYDFTKPTPLLVVLHGYSASGRLEAAYLGLDYLADEAGVLVIAPDGTAESGGAQFWNATEVCCDFYDSKVDDVAYLTGLVREISAEYNVDSKRVFLVGHSNGGFMSYRLACDHPELFAALVSLAGATYLDPERCAPKAPVSVLQIHGDADDIVLYEGEAAGAGLLRRGYPGALATVTSWAAYDGCAGALAGRGDPLDLDGASPGAETTREGFSSCPRGVAVELWTLHGGGHLPGVKPAFRTAVWEWLSAHPRPQGRVSLDIRGRDRHPARPSFPHWAEAGRARNGSKHRRAGSQPRAPRSTVAPRERCAPAPKREHAPWLLVSSARRSA